MKIITKQFSNGKDFVGGMEISMQVPTVDDLKDWAENGNDVALQNAAYLLEAQLRSHEFSSAATRDGEIYSDPQKSENEQNEAYDRLSSVYKLDWNSPRFGKTRKGNRWQGYGAYVPLAKIQLGIKDPTDEQIIAECKAIKEKMEG